jgi:excisionase family DNA binding protein
MPALSQALLRNAKALPRLLSIKQATYELGISRTSIYELIAANKLRTIKIGRRRFVAIEAINEFIAGLSVDGVDR